MLAWLVSIDHLIFTRFKMLMSGIPVIEKKKSGVFFKNVLQIFFFILYILVYFLKPFT